KIILTFLEVLINNRDYLYNEINQLLYGEKYNSYYRSEQFRRTYFYSLIPLFDFLDETLFLKNEFEFHELKNEFFENRERIINVLAKNSLSNKKNDIESIKDFRNSIESISNRLYYYIKNKFNYIHDFIIEENNYLEDKQTILSSDSEDQFFVLNNIRKESNVNDNFSFWKSSNEMIVHWILIDFKEYRLINKIIIEHHSSNAYITKQFSIYGLSENGWIMLVEIKQNTEKRSYFYYKIPIKLRKIKINIEKPNYGVDYTARIKLIEIC
ncbi:MAG: discoidin domain-containing protein, partial [Bacilli bacterium]